MGAAGKSAQLLLIAVLLACLVIPAAATSPRTTYAQAGPNRTVYAGETVWLNGTAASDKDIVKYEWDFDGDGSYDWSSVADGNASHVYGRPGVYNAVFRVTDSGNGLFTDNATITVKGKNLAPYAEAGPDKSGEAGAPVSFNGTATDQDGRITKYEWDFESDGDWDYSGVSGNASHAFKSPGEYHALLRVTDNGTPAASDTDIVKVTIYNPNQRPAANAGPAVSALAGESVLLVGRGFDPDGVIVLYEWDFDGDGRWDWSSASTGTASWKYFEPGTYVAALRVTDNGPIPQSDLSTATVTVRPGNAPPLLFGPSELDATTGEPVRLTVFAVDPDPGDRVQRLGWDLDGNGLVDYYSPGDNATHIFNSSGVHRVKVTAIDTRNATANWTISVKVADPPPEEGLLGRFLPFLLVLLAGLGIGAAGTAPFMVWYMKRHWERFFKPTKYERMKMRAEQEEEGRSGGFRGMPPEGGDDSGDRRWRDLGT